MLGFVIQRLLQALVVMLAISILVFVGVYAIGNPIDVLISPDADQRIRELAIKQYGLDLPLWQQYLTFLGRVVSGDFGKIVRLQHAGARPDLLAPAGDARAHARRRDRRNARRRAARHVCGLSPRQRRVGPDHGVVDPRLLGADLLGRPGADPHLCGVARLAAGRRPRRDRGGVRRRMELPHAERLGASVPARAESWRCSSSP